MLRIQRAAVLVVIIIDIVIVLIERDAVLFSQRGILVVLARRTMISATKSQIQGAGTSLLQLSRFFEAAMTTLLHGRAPNLEK